jgi:PKD repeat protein
VYTYNLPGSYSVLLNVSQAGEDSVSITQEDYITVSAVPLEPPVADFSGEPTSGVAPLTVSFADLSSNSPTSWNWTFGDDSTDNLTTRNPVHTYTNPGTYSVSLSATNTVGLNITTKTGYINVTAAPLGPVADFSGTPTSGIAPLTVQFNDTSTGFVNPVTYLWDFGDGSTSTERNPSHSYTAYTPENYTVTLNVTGNYGKADSRIKSGYISIEIPTIELIISDSPPDQSMLANGLISPDQSLPQTQSYPPSKLVLQAQSYPQDISSQKDLSADSSDDWVWIHTPGHVDWTLISGPNPKPSAFWMTVISSGNWWAFVYDANSDGKSNDAGKMAEYDYIKSEYVDGGHSLQDPLHVQSGPGQTLFGVGPVSGEGPLVVLNGEHKIIQSGGGPVIEFFPINLNQYVQSNDYGLGQDRGYRIVITFEATTSLI